MKLGILIPRYGSQALGGAELHMQMLAEHLVALRSWEVEVFTSCATSAATWADELPESTTVENGVTVHRHRSRSGRDRAYLTVNPSLRRHPSVVPDSMARRFVELVGPVCPGAVDHAAGSGCDLVATAPYLYWTTVTGVPRLGARSVMHTMAHDEPEFHLPLMAEVFSAAGGFAFNTRAERAMIERAFGVGQLPGHVVGVGVVPVEGEEDRARMALGLDREEPFVLCLGRVERDKSAHVLAELWSLYRRRRPTAPRLVLVGPVHDTPPPTDACIVTGPQPESVKWGALRGCRFLVSPSAWESFSMVLLEAWTAGKPVVVNSRCAATVEHCRRSGGGAWFTGYADFEAVMDRLLSDASLRNELAANGAAYVEREFSWPAVVDRYEELTERVMRRKDVG